MRSNGGRDFVVTLLRTWGAQGCLTRSRSRALDAAPQEPCAQLATPALASADPAPMRGRGYDARRKTTLRGAMACIATIARLRERHARDHANVPSVRTMQPLVQPGALAAAARAARHPVRRLRRAPRYLPPATFEAVLGVGDVALGAGALAGRPRRRPGPRPGGAGRPRGRCAPGRRRSTCRDGALHEHRGAVVLHLEVARAGREREPLVIERAHPRLARLELGDQRRCGAAGRRARPPCPGRRPCARPRRTPAPRA